MIPFFKLYLYIDANFTGLSSAVGVGGYVMVGVASSEWAGPSVVLSVLLAAVTSMLTGKHTL